MLIILNRAKKQYLHPHNFGCSMRFSEWGRPDGPLVALAFLLCPGRNRFTNHMQATVPDASCWGGSWQGDVVDFVDISNITSGLVQDIRDSRDISDNVICDVVNCHHGLHPWAALDKQQDGWRTTVQWGVIPAIEPKDPAAGWDNYNRYVGWAQSKVNRFIDQLEGFNYPDRIRIGLEALLPSHLVTEMMSAPLDELVEHIMRFRSSNLEPIANSLLVET